MWMGIMLVNVSDTLKVFINTYVECFSSTPKGWSALKHLKCFLTPLGVIQHH